jgi:hypothetical protein
MSDATAEPGIGDEAQGSEESPGTLYRLGLAVAYFVLLGFGVGGAVTAVTDALLLPVPPLSLGTLATAAVAGVLSGLREPPSTGRVLAFSLLAAAIVAVVRWLDGGGAGELRGSWFVAVEATLTWVAAFLLAYALVFGVDWARVRERLRSHLLDRSSGADGPR